MSGSAALAIGLLPGPGAPALAMTTPAPSPRALVVWAVQVGRVACPSRAVVIATLAHLLGLLRTAACACAWLARPVCSRLWITGLKRRFGCDTGGTEIERLRKQQPPLGFATSKSQFLGKDEQDLDGTCQAPSV
jgi:hypothetical protein